MSPYSYYRPFMKTGDVIAFSGKGRISGIIKRATRSAYSHVGLVVNSTMSDGFGQSVLLVESTTLGNLPDIISGKVIRGVQMQWLSQRIAAYPGKVWWVPLRQSIPEEKSVAMLRWIRSIHARQAPYDTIQAIGSALDWWDRLGFTNKRDSYALFCSELVAYAWQVAGIIPETINPSECTPQDIMQFSCLDKPIKVM